MPRLIYKPAAVSGFPGCVSECSEIEKEKYIRYMKKSAKTLMSWALEDIALLKLMIEYDCINEYVKDVHKDVFYICYSSFGITAIKLFLQPSQKILLR